MELSAEYITDFSLSRLAGAKVRHGLLRRKRQVDGFWRQTETNRTPMLLLAR